MWWAWLRDHICLAITYQYISIANTVPRMGGKKKGSENEY